MKRQARFRSWRSSAGGPLGALTKLRSHRPFALSLSKGCALITVRAELVEALGAWQEGFDKLSPNGVGWPFDKLRANGNLRTVEVAFGSQAAPRVSWSN